MLNSATYCHHYLVKRLQCRQKILSTSLSLELITYLICWHYYVIIWNVFSSNYTQTSASSRAGKWHSVNNVFSLWLLPLHFKHLSSTVDDECQVIYSKLRTYWVGQRLAKRLQTGKHARSFHLYRSISKSCERRLVDKPILINNFANNASITFYCLFTLQQPP